MRTQLEPKGSEDLGRKGRKAEQGAGVTRKVDREDTGKKKNREKKNQWEAVGMGWRDKEEKNWGDTFPGGWAGVALHGLD